LPAIIIKELLIFSWYNVIDGYLPDPLFLSVRPLEAVGRYANGS
jgi:hypothetical protein